MTVRSSILGPQGPFAIKIWRHLYSNAHRLVPAYLFGAAVVASRQLPSCHGYAGVGGARTTRTLNRGPRQSPAKRVWWGEEEQGSGMTDAHTWASGIKRTLRRRCPPDESAQENRSASPVTGVRGKPPMSARRAKALIEGGPGGSLVTFCPHRK